MVIKKNNFIYISIFLIIAILSVWILGYYTEGDQEKYILVYDKMNNFSLYEAYSHYYSILSSLEFGHFFIIWIASSLGIDKNFLIAISNGMLAVSFLYYGKKLNASLLVLIPVVFTNYYFLAVYTELERLKFAFLFFILSLIVIENKKLFYLLSVVALLTHLQFLVFYASFLFKLVLQQFQKVLMTYKINWSLVIIVVGLVIIILVMGEHLSRKLRYYFQGLDYLAFFKAIPFFILALYYSKKKKETTVFFSILSFSILLVGGDRLNIFAYFLFLYYGLQYNRGLNFGVFVTTIYFAIKSISFIGNIFEYGRGY